MSFTNSDDMGHNCPTGEGKKREVSRKRSLFRVFVVAIIHGFEGEAERKCLGLMCFCDSYVDVVCVVECLWFLLFYQVAESGEEGGRGERRKE